MKILHLVVKNKWYDLIEKGIKKEEYRSIKPYWNNRFRCQAYGICDLHTNCIRVANGLGVCDKYTHVQFHKGYTNTTMTFEIENITLGLGKSEWGAPAEEVFIIKLGERYDPR